jgi:hypothetical protein
LLLLVQSVWAQRENPVYLILPDQVRLEAGLNSIDLQLINSSEKDFTGELRLQLPQGLRALGSDRLIFTVPAGKKRFITQRLQVQAPAQLRGQTVGVQLWDPLGNIVDNKTMVIEVPPKKALILQDISEQQYLKHVGDSIFLRTRAINNGTTDEQIKILFSSPDRIGNTKFKEQNLFLPAGRDTLLVLRFAVEKYMLNRAQYTVSITGLYDNGDVFGNLAVLLSNIAADRNYQQLFDNRGNLAAYSRNFFDLQLDNLLGEQQAFYFRSEGEYRIANGQLKYSAYLTKTGGVNRPTLSNTYAAFQKGKNIYTVGNLQESMEASAFGKGIKFDHIDTAKTANFTVGILQRAVDLLDYSSSQDPGYTAFGKVVLGEGKAEQRRYEGQLFYDRNGLDSTTSLLWANSFDFLKQKYAGNTVLRGFVAAGLQSQDGRQAGLDSSMPSWALGLRMDQRFAKWSFSSDNFYSSPYYTGNRRGSLQFVERVNRNLGKLSTALSYTFYRYNPSYLNTHYLNYASQSSRWDLSIYMPLSSFVTLSLLPNYNREKGTYMFSAGARELNSASWRMLSTVNARSRNLQHNLNVTTEAGLVSMTGQASGIFAIRTDLNYNYKSLGLTASYQQGAFQISDLVSALLIGRSFGNRFSLGPRVSGALWQERLQWTANARANLSSSYGNSFGGNASINYRVLKNTLLTGLFQYNYSVMKTGYDYDFNNLRIGIRQNLKGSNLDRPAIKTGNIRVFCFYDKNFNGIFDKGDIPVVDHGFTVKGVLFVTDKAGYASFKKLPYGSYLFFSPKQGQYMAVSKEILIQQSNAEIQIPLQRGGMVRGTVHMEYTQGLSLETDLNLDIYKVFAKDRNGKIVEIRTDKDGNFEFGLPEGTYSFYLDNSSFPANVFTDQEALSGAVKLDAELVLEPFVLKVKSKKVNVKRFGP